MLVDEGDQADGHVEAPPHQVVSASPAVPLVHEEQALLQVGETREGYADAGHAWPPVDEPSDALEICRFYFLFEEIEAPSVESASHAKKKW